MFFVVLIFWQDGIAAHVAQLVEHVLGKDEVSGSIPLMGSKEWKSRLDGEGVTKENVSWQRNNSIVQSHT